MDKITVLIILLLHDENAACDPQCLLESGRLGAHSYSKVFRKTEAVARRHQHAFSRERLA